MGQNVNIAMADTVDTRLAGLNLAGRLSLLSSIGSNAVFTTSLGIEDQVLTAAIAQTGVSIRLATLQTGRLFDETLELIERTERRYGVQIERYQPEPDDVSEYIRTFGRDGFYDSVEARHACCGFRKLKPLARALDGADVWITGLRRGQSDGRAAVSFAEWDDGRALLKASPLADWERADIETYVATNDVPINPLHARGYPSIGCEPCTRAIRPGEPERAGRWWWEQDQKRECGLHMAQAEGAAHD